MASTEYILGFAAGLVAILIVFAVIRKATGGKTLKGEYDERQQLIRLKGYMYAFFTTLILLVLYAFTASLMAQFPLYPGEVAFAIIIISVVVYALYCVKRDVFFGIRQHSRAYILLLLFVVISNLLSAIVNARDGGWLDPNGMISFSFFSSILCIVGFGAVLAALLIKRSSSDREESEDEES